MPPPLPVSLARWLFCCVSLAAGLALPLPTRADDAVAATPITVEFWVAELSVPAMRGFGIDINGPAKAHAGIGLAEMFTSPQKMPPLVAKDLPRFLDYLRARQVASVIAQPKLVIPSGAKGSMTIGNLQLDVTPTLQDSGTIQVRHQLDIREPLPVAKDVQRAGASVVGTCSTIDVDSGKAVLACPCISGGASGSAPDKLLLVMLRATKGEAAAAEATSIANSDLGSTPR